MIISFVREYYFYTVVLSIALFFVLEHIICGRLLDSPRKNRWPHNIGLWLLNSVLAAMLPISAFAAAYLAYQSGVGVLNNVSLPFFAVVIISVLVRSFAQYCFHRLMHGVPAFWAIHQVHHSDNTLDSSTSLRFHPFELALNIGFLIPFVVAFGLNASVLLVFELLLNLYGMLGHSRLPLPVRFSKMMRYVLITPALHRLHHSEYMPETNSNFSADFSCWDRLFGTYLDQSVRAPGAFKVGLSEIDERLANNFDGIVCSPFNYWAEQVSARRVRGIDRSHARSQT